MNKPTLLYVMDPLCGWCYGFSPVVKSLQENWRDRLNFRVITGGMITGARVEPIAAMAGYILKAYRNVEGHTGVTFGEAYLNVLRQGTAISNSEPSCRAIHAFSLQNPDLGIDFAHALQLGIFQDGHDWNNPEYFAEVAVRFGWEREAFLNIWNADAVRYSTQQEFQWVQAAGINGFPCVILEKKEQYYLVAQGYRPIDDVNQVLGKILSDSEV
jgi:putative protein-disulfide isomerase